MSTLKKCCKLSNPSNFEEHVNVTTIYLGRYMAQGGLECWNEKYG